MPIYEYECTACHTRFERRQAVHDKPVETCPECGAPTRRVLHPVGIIFKGSGFYVTDNRKPSTPAGTGTSKENGASGEGDGHAKADAVSSGKSESGEKAKSGSAEKSDG